MENKEIVEECQYCEGKDIEISGLDEEIGTLTDDIEKLIEVLEDVKYTVVEGLR